MYPDHKDQDDEDCEGPRVIFGSIRLWCRHDGVHFCLGMGVCEARPPHEDKQSHPKTHMRWEMGGGFLIYFSLFSFSSLFSEAYARVCAHSVWGLDPIAGVEGVEVPTPSPAFSLFGIVETLRIFQRHVNGPIDSEARLNFPTARIQDSKGHLA